MRLEYTRLTLALLLSLLMHALLLSLTFSGQGLGLPGFGFPWRERRIEAPDLRVVVIPAQASPVGEPLPPAQVGQTVAAESSLKPSASRAATPRQTAVAILTNAPPVTDVAPVAAAAQLPLHADRPSDTAPPPIPAPAAIAVARTDETAWVVPAAPTPPLPIATAPPIPAIPAASGTSSTDTAIPTVPEAGDAARARIDPEVREGAVDTARPDPAGQERQRQAEQLDAARQEATRAENARLEANRQEAERQAAVLLESAKAAAQQQAALRDAARIEAARVEAARVEAARADAARAEAARAEAARAEAARLEGIRAEAAKGDAAQEAAARREAVLRAIGRQLDDEAARRDAAKAAARQSPSSSGARRYRLFGRTDPNAEIIHYAEAWSRKIQMNMTFDMVRQAAKQPHTDPVVTVAIRSDGSVESVTFVVSSGVAALDEAIRGVVRSQAPYPVFPPDLVRDFDVIEIRRTWYFDMAIRLY